MRSDGRALTAAPGRGRKSCFYLSFILCCCLLFSTIVPSGSCSGLGGASWWRMEKLLATAAVELYAKRTTQQRILSRQWPSRVVHGYFTTLTSFFCLSGRTTPSVEIVGRLVRACCICFIPIFAFMKWDFWIGHSSLLSIVRRRFGNYLILVSNISTFTHLNHESFLQFIS